MLETSVWLASLHGRLRNIRMALPLRAVLFASALLGMSSIPAVAVPVVNQIALHAVSGSQFGAAAPTVFVGTFTVDSAFLEQADGDYPGSNVSAFFIVIGVRRSVQPRPLTQMFRV